ncbi:phage tail protein [Anaerovibrio sp.]|uniref:gp53-like domain-containing protein n=1 Tax=Anaerovibrio sp. TaxID=1872532 RepID=UPI0025B855A9|nr:phage tail protein [Anaerovibrio sp.]MBR2143206.1 phage tail protein [Anaerovibrio sp.]
MSSYPNMLVVNQGLDLISESIAENKALIFTKVKLGDGTLSPGQDIATMTDLINPMMTVGLSAGTQMSNGQAKLRFSVDNANLDTGFFAREVAIFAKVGNDGIEQLYAYTNGRNYVDYIPDKTNPIDAQIIDVYVIIGNATNVEISIDTSAYMSIEDLNDHNNSTEAHANLLSGTSFGQSVIEHLLGSALASFFDAVSTDSVFSKLLKLALEAAGLRYSMGTNGYICLGSLFGYLILQWGTGSIPSTNGVGDAAVITLPIEFSYSSSYRVYITPHLGYTGNNAISATVFDVSNAYNHTNDIHVKRAPANTTILFNWFAIGY